MPKPKVELVSITYKINGKIFTKTITPATPERSGPASKKSADKHLSMTAHSHAIAPAHPDALDNGCGEGARCVNGFLEILICFGSTCQWVPTNTPCNC
jgi:hypothetical protein